MTRTVERVGAQLRARVLPRELVTSEQRDAMWRCFEATYLDVTRARFDRDLDAKDTVILLEDAGGNTQGFSTLCVERHAHPDDGSPLVVVFSGDTVILPDFWGDHALQSAFFGCVLEAVQHAQGAPVYWFLISKGYKTYLLLARNFLRFWPRRDVETPAHVARVIDMLSRRRFGDAWDPARGTLRFTEALGRLRAGVAPIEGRAAEDPDVAFFVRVNPGHASGEELCCLGLFDAQLAIAYTQKLDRLRGAR